MENPLKKLHHAPLDIATISSETAWGSGNIDDSMVMHHDRCCFGKVYDILRWLPPAFKHLGVILIILPKGETAKYQDQHHGYSGDFSEKVKR